MGFHPRKCGEGGRVRATTLWRMQAAMRCCCHIYFIGQLSRHLVVEHDITVDSVNCCVFTFQWSISMAIKNRATCPKAAFVQVPRSSICWWDIGKRALSSESHFPRWNLPMGEKCLQSRLPVGAIYTINQWTFLNNEDGSRGFNYVVIVSDSRRWMFP